MNLLQLLKGIDCRYHGNSPEIGNITCRPDEVTNGTLFVCIKGSHADGHDFAQAALQKSAAAIVSERDLGIREQVLVSDSRVALSLLSAAFYGHPSEKLTMIGITGTNGKTTTACWVRNILAQANRNTMLIGTLGVDSGDGFEQTAYTTPEADVFNRKLQEGVAAGCKCAVAEISSQALSQHRCAGLVFDVAVFTNLSEEHLDYHRSMQEYAEAKAKLFENARTAVINADDEYARFILSHCKGNVITCSLQDDADLTAKNIQYSENGVSYILVSRDGLARIRIASHGVMAVYNSMLSVAAGIAAGVGFEEACCYVCNVQQVEGRMQKVSTKEAFSVYTDYAHTPAALYEALCALRQITTGKLIVVFGCGGDRDRTKRPKMGEIASSLADVTILTDDNPRTENAENITKEIAAGFRSRKELLIIPDRRTAIETAILKAHAGDCVLIAGKGHEKTQQTAKGTFPFHDASVVCDFLAVNSDKQK